MQRAAPYMASGTVDGTTQYRRRAPAQTHAWGYPLFAGFTPAAFGGTPITSSGLTIAPNSRHVCDSLRKYAWEPGFPQRMMVRTRRHDEFSRAQPA